LRFLTDFPGFHLPLAGIEAASVQISILFARNSGVRPCAQPGAPSIRRPAFSHSNKIGIARAG